MAKHSDTTWKQDHPSTLFGNSVQKADRLLKQAQSHPDEEAFELAFNQIQHAENAHSNAVEFGEHMDIIEQNNDYLEQIRQQLQIVQSDYNRPY